MELALFRRIIEEVVPITEQVCFHLMGEPLVHPELPEFVSICEEARTKIFFVTNGVLLREGNAELLLSPAFEQVNFSLHSFYDNYPDQDPGPYLDRIFRWTERAFLERPDLYINYRLWNLSSVGQTGLKNRDLLTRVQDRFGVRLSSRDDSCLRKSRRIINRLYLHFDTEFTWPSLTLPVTGELGRCHGLASHFGILVDGTVVPCCLDKEGVISLGNMRESPILEILESPRAQSILEGFQKGRLVEPLCQRCQFVKRFGKSAG